MGGLFGPKGQNTTEPRLNSIQVNQSAYGAVIPLVYGKTRIPIGLMWYGAFKATPHTQSQGGKGGGGASSTSYTYSAALMLSLCEGQVSSPTKLWSDKDQKSLADLGLTFASGAGGQAIWSYLTTNFPAQAIPYDHTAYLYSSAFDLGNSAAMPNITVEEPGLFSNAASPLSLNGDVEPATILTDYCSDANHGCGFSFLDGAINGTGVTSFSSYAIAMGFYLSPAELTQRSAAEFISEVLRICNSAPVWSAGVLRIIPYADASVSGNGRTYTPDLTPPFAFSDDDYLFSDGEDPVRATLKPADQIFNIVRIEYRDRASDYNTAVAEASDADHIALNGERPMANIRFDSITVASVARQVAQLILQRQMYYRNTYEFRVRSDFCLLEPMDLVSITDSGLGITGILCRVQQIDDSPDDVITLTVEEMPVGPAAAPLYSWDSAQGYAANWNFAPGAINAPVFFMAPQALCQSPNQAELWCAVSGPAATWGGCYVWLSMDGTTYRLAGTITGPARHGTLTANIAAGGADPDVTNTLSVLLANTALALASGTTADADNLRTLLWVDGEIMSFRDVSLTGVGTYNITRLKRGRYGSANAAHLSGTYWARLDSAVLRIPIDPGMMGQLLFLKFQPFNTVGHGLVDISSVSAYSKFLNPTPLSAPGFRMLNSAGAMVIGTTFYKTNQGTANAWSDAVWSADGYSNGCVLSCHAAPPIAAELMLGLALNPTASVSYTNLAFALYLQSGTLKVYEAGALKATIGSYAERDQLSIQYDGQFVRYYQNQACVWSTFAPGLKLFLQCCLYSIGATVTDVSFSPFSGESVSTADSIAFLDTFEHQNYKAFYYDAGSGSPTIDYPSDGVAGGRVIRIAGAQAWKVHGQNIPYDSAQLYKITARVRRTVAPSNAGKYIYVGVTAVAADGVTLLNSVGANSESSQHYCCLAGFDLSTIAINTWYDAVGYFSGSGAFGSPSTDPAAPAPLYAGTRYFRPLFIANYSGGDGTMEIDFIKVEKLPSVSTPQIDPHAVTDVASATNASTDVYTSGTTPTQVLSVAVGPYPFATEMVVTAIGRIDHNLTAGHQSSTYADVTDFTTSSSIGGSNTIIARNPNTTDTRVQQSYALEKRYSVAANTSKTFYLYGQGASISAAGSTCLMLDSLLKVEVIKR